MKNKYFGYLLIIFLADTDTTGKHIVKVLDFCEKEFGENFPSICMMLGSITLALHYGQISTHVENIAIPIVLGPPGCGKSKAMELVFGMIGAKEKLQGKTIYLFYLFRTLILLYYFINNNK